MKSDTSIRKTLLLITLLTSCTAVALATGAFLTAEYYRARGAMQRNTSVLAEVIGSNSGAAILFDDSATAEETLAALRAESHVIASVLYTPGGEVFASYVREDVQGFSLPDDLQTGVTWSGDHFDLVQDIVADHESIGTVFIRSDTEEMTAVMAQFVAYGGLILLVAVAVSWLGASRLRSQIATPLAALASGADLMAEGDLSARVDMRGGDELGTLAQVFNKMAESLAGLVSRVRGNTRSVSEVTLRLQEASDAMHSEASRQQTAVEETADSIEKMSQSISSVNAAVETLSETATETSAASLEMDTSIQGIASHVDELSVTIDQVASSVNEMTSAIAEIARGADTLNGATSSTSDSLHLLNRSVKDVEETAEQSHALAQRSTSEAQRGVESVQETVDSMKEIQSSFHGLQDVILRLQEKSESIGEVIKVIEGVVEQTNLLALNAAIISSHAGEHGRAFAVVAQEVKNLADRTAGSTREIAGLIEGVQREVGDAVEAMGQGQGRVERGVKLSTEAGEILSAIGTSAKESIEMAKRIAASTGGQARDIEHVESAMGQVQEIAKQLNRGTHEQDSASAEITRGVERMRQLGSDVKRSTGEQRKESQHITESVEIVAGRIQEILAATTEQSKQAEQILQALTVFRDVTDSSGRRAADLKHTVEVLSGRAEELQSEVDRFNV